MRRTSIHAGAVLQVLLAVACASGTDIPDAGARDGGPTRDAGFAISSTRALSVMSWNIERFPKNERTAAEVVDILGEYAPDVVGVQELADPFAFEDLVDALPDYEGAYVQNDRLAVGFMYRPDRVRVSDVKPIFMDDAFAFPRAPLSAFIEVVDEFDVVRFDFVFIVVHLKAQGDARSQYRRIAAIEELDEYIRAATGERDFVVVGDYNDRLTDERGNNVFLPMLDDPMTYTFLTLRLEQSGEKSYIPIPGFIDHIMITNEVLPAYGLGKTESIAIEALRPSYESVVSDHRPIRAIFQLP